MGLQNSVGTQRQFGVAGGAADSISAAQGDVITKFNADGVETQSNTVTISTAAAGTYSVLVNSVEVEYVDAGGSTSDIASGLAAALESEPLVNNAVEVSVAAAVITLVSRQSGEGYTVSLGQSSGNMALATVQANGAGNNIGFGLAVIDDGFDGAKLVNSTDITNGADADAKIIGVTGNSNRIQIPLDGSDPAYEPKDAMGIRRTLRVDVPVEAQPSSGDSVYVRVAANGSLDVIGGFSNAAGTGLVEWSVAKWARAGRGGLATLELPRG